TSLENGRKPVFLSLRDRRVKQKSEAWDPVISINIRCFLLIK
ncbi:CDP-diacylglycerol--glycerol-3-phosphate 3-phosphatidyltransferase, partial [Vibrio cholerae HC-17A1]